MFTQKFDQLKVGQVFKYNINKVNTHDEPIVFVKLAGKLSNFAYAKDYPTFKFEFNPDDMVESIFQYQMSIAPYDVILLELDKNSTYKKILRLSSIQAINKCMQKKGITLSKANCLYIHP